MQLEESNTMIYHDNTPAENLAESHTVYALKLVKTISVESLIHHLKGHAILLLQLKSSSLTTAFM